jgi:hypothetical protein
MTSAPRDLSSSDPVSLLGAYADSHEAPERPCGTRRRIPPARVSHTATRRGEDE